MEIKGKIIDVLDVRSGISTKGDNWRSQDAVLQTEDMYPKKICFNMYGDKIIPLAIGDSITVEIEVTSREFNGKWYTTVKALKITKTDDF